MEIKVRTLKDRIYDNVLPIAIVFVVTVFIIIMTIASYNNNIDRELLAQEQAKKSNLHETFKVNAIKTSKPTLICKGKHILLPTEYDMVKIKFTNFIITEEAKPLWQNTHKLSECEVYTHVTDTMKPKPIIPIDRRHQAALKARDISLNSLTNSINSYKISNANYVVALEEANNMIVELKELVKTQRDSITELSITKAKYLEVKELLTIVLEKRDINIEDLIIKPQPVKIVAIDIKETIKRAKPIKVDKVKPAPNNLSTIEYAKRIIFAIKTVNEMHTHPSLNFQGPTQADLDKILVETKNMEDIEYTDKLLKALRIRVNIYAKVFKYNRVEVRNIIRTNIGV